jgi:hypothetical protein
MRRIFATILMSTLLMTVAPFMRDSGHGRDWDPIRIIKKIVRHLLPTPTDVGDGLGTPKP